MPASKQAIDYQGLAAEIKLWAKELGFQQTGITDTDLSDAEQRLMDWLDQGYQGEMSYMASHGSKRSRPEELVPDTQRIISVRMDYFSPEDDPIAQLEDPGQAFVSRYALGRDYHKLMRNKLQRLADRIAATVGPFGYRAYVDSAPVMEKPLAVRAGLGWIGKHTNLINTRAGSWFFLGELYTDLPLPVDQAAEDHCGSCSDCLTVCPTQAIIAPYQLDARRCISYLTIELAGPIPVEFRSMMGNRIYGCDDCQQVCPWNRFAQTSMEQDFLPRQGLDRATLLELFAWTEEEFLRKTEGSAIRRIGYDRWSRNIAVALGNAPSSPEIVRALKEKETGSELVKEHIEWALQRQVAKGSESRVL